VIFSNFCPRSLLISCKLINKEVLQSLEEYLKSFQSCFEEFDNDDIWLDDEDDLNFCKLIILHGDVSSGKTAFLSTLSDDYNIIELHPGECRSGPRIKQRIGEACSSKRIQLDGDAVDFFGQTKAKSSSKRELHTDDGNKKSTLIHIEHPEIACAEDSNFYCTLGNLCRRSKVPFIITTNKLDFILDSLDVPDSAKLIECKRPSIEYCMYRVLLILTTIASAQISNKPRFPIDSSVHGEHLHSVIEELIKSHDRDLRKVLLNLASHAPLPCFPVSNNYPCALMRRKN